MDYNLKGDQMILKNAAWRCGYFFFIVVLFLGGCAVGPDSIRIAGTDIRLVAGTIYATDKKQPILFDALLDELLKADVIYVGETHIDPKHHDIQLKILKAIHQRYPHVVVGMEMFDRTYQPVLDQWARGNLEYKAFLRQTHWYANWKYPDRLYRDILNFIRTNRIPLKGLNLPFHIPAKISIGGLASLHPSDRQFVPKKIDTSHTAHREYVKKIYDRHKIPGRELFENFYLAQCVWEDTMAEVISANWTSGTKWVVFAGNGHIINKFGVPDRVFQRTSAPFKTVFPVSVNGDIEMSAADFLWVTPVAGLQRKNPHR
jgi:uncharacterized iron-regulated protein